MSPHFFDIYHTIALPTDTGPSQSLYAVARVPSFPNCYVGKDTESKACILIKIKDITGAYQPPIRLQSLDVQFDLRCKIREPEGIESEETFTVVRCRSLDSETIHYFFSVCQAFPKLLGGEPTKRDVASVVDRLATIFQKLQNPSVRSVNGMFGELYFILRSNNPIRTLSAWRLDDTARFDFADKDIRIEIKTTGGRVRSHIFSYEQCNPPLDTIAVVGSLFVERIPGGRSLKSIIDEIEQMVVGDQDLVFKLHDVIAETLGSSLTEALDIKFDLRLADETIQYFNLTEVPAIRENLPPRVTNVHFRSDLTSIQALTPVSLIDSDPYFLDLLPHQQNM